MLGRVKTKISFVILSGCFLTQNEANRRTSDGLTCIACGSASLLDGWIEILGLSVALESHSNAI